MDFFTNRVCRGIDGLEDVVAIGFIASCSSMVMMFFGFDPLLMIVTTPAAVARSAAMSFVVMPPVPNELPGVETVTF